MGDNQLLDIGRRVELAGLELLKAWTLLTELTTAANMRTARDKSVEADYPGASIEGVMFTEFGRFTGNYDGLMRLSALTHEAHDKDLVKVKKILGALRGWSQQENLKTQMNNSVAANAVDTKLTVFFIQSNGVEYEASETERINEWILEVKIVACPSKA